MWRRIDQRRRLRIVPVEQAAQAAAAELQQVQAGRTARVLVWRGDRQVFVTIRKE